MNKNIRILGSGLICVDVVHSDSGIKIMNGGSCANVISVMAQIGYNCSIIRECYSDFLEPFLSNTLSSLGVKELFYRKTKSKTPRIVEEIYNTQHDFYTICPHCGKKILDLKLPSEDDVKSLFSQINDMDVFYSDRASSGILMLMEWFNQKNGVVVFEPNSARNSKGLYFAAACADIIKFSKERISYTIAERIRINNDRAKLIIYTEGAKGLLFAHRMLDGKMSDWLSVPSVFQGPVIDSSGAGDWLTAGFLSELLKDRKALSLNALLDAKEVTKMLKKGMKYSKLCCAAIGAQGVFYSPEHANQFYKLFRGNKKVKKLLLNSEKVSDADVCPYCFSGLTDREIKVI